MELPLFDSRIHIGQVEFEKLSVLVNNNKGKHIVLVDKNTKKYCLTYLQKQCPELKKAEIITINSGEKYKTIKTATLIWTALQQLKADRNTTLICLGGGVVLDIGGFAASTFKRGINFINIPTTLLAQVDASIGGKTGIDLLGVKNQIGTFAFPCDTFIDTHFLNTLPKKEFTSGMAEVIKHALIADKRYWMALKQKTLSIDEIVSKSIMIKRNIVLKDPNEKGLRKVLNFGHTVGHAIESYLLLTKKQNVLHGNAIAAGMICEAFISQKQNRISKAELIEITSYIKLKYPFIPIGVEVNNKLIALMLNDKKNEGGKINFSLVSVIGTAVYDEFVDKKTILASLAYYRKIYSSNKN